MAHHVRRLNHHATRPGGLIVLHHRLLDDGQLDEGIGRLLDPSNRADGAAGVPGLGEVAKVDGEGHGEVGGGEVERLLALGPGLLHHALHLHVVAVPVLAARRRPRRRPLPLDAPARGRGGLVELAAHVDHDGEVQVLGALRHGAHVHVVLVEGGIGVAEQDSGEFLGVRPFQVLRDGRTVRQPLSATGLVLPHDHGMPR